MNWKGFKDMLEKRGVDDDTEIIYIDINDPDEETDVQVTPLGLIVTD